MRRTLVVLLENDCACRLCPVTDQRCTYGLASPVTTDSPQNCGLTGTVDEPAILQEALGCR